MQSKTNIVGYPGSPSQSLRGPPRTPEGPPPRDHSGSPGTPDMRSFDQQTSVNTPEYANSPDKSSHGRKSASSRHGDRTHSSKRPITPPEPYPGSPSTRKSLVANEYGNEGETDLSRSNSPPSMTAMLVANSSYRRPPSPPVPSDRIAHRYNEVLEFSPINITSLCNM